jgi:hypothetical protein
MALTSQERLRVVEILDTWASAGESPQAAVAKVLEEFPDIELSEIAQIAGTLLGDRTDADASVSAIEELIRIYRT